MCMTTTAATTSGGGTGSSSDEDEAGGGFSSHNHHREPATNYSNTEPPHHVASFAVVSSSGSAPAPTPGASDWLEASREVVAQAKSEAEAKWPRKGIEKPHPNDVLYGRGGGTNHHQGNKRYRKMVEDRKQQYVNSKRLEKPLIAFEIIRQWRAQDPPGRFLKKDRTTGLWNDVGDAEARKKTSQALREQAPLIRELGMASGGGGDDDGNNDGGDDDDDDDGYDVEREHTRTVSVASQPNALPIPNAALNVEDVLLDEECLTSDQPHLHFPTLGQINLSSASSVPMAMPIPEREMSFGRDHSLGDYPLPHASVSQSALDAAFDHRTGAWATPPNYFAITKQTSTAVGPGGIRPSVVSSTISSHGTRNLSTDTTTASVPLQASVATAMSSLRHESMASNTDMYGLETMLSDDASASDSSSEVAKRRPTFHRHEPFDAKLPASEPVQGVPSSSDQQQHGHVSLESFLTEHYVPPPMFDISKDAIKRATSHQNETYETKRYLVGPSVKRVALSRDGTTGSVPFDGTPPPVEPTPFDENQAIRELTQTMEKSTLEPSVEPLSLAVEERSTTVDRIAFDLFSYPVSLSRVNTEEMASHSPDLDEDYFNHLLEHML